MKKQRIAVLMHERLENIPESYLINVLAHFWQQDGHEVIFLFGTEEFVLADLLFVHVDLSVVPDAYLAFAKRYPIIINGNVKDIRKSAFSHGLLKPGDDWDGPVIVKSNKNYAGVPERRRTPLKSVGGRIRQRLLTGLKNRWNLEWIDPSIDKPQDYKIYERLQQVPWPYFYHPELIVQKFTPEIEDGYYHLRLMLFMGDRMRCTRLKADHPIVNSGTIEEAKYDIKPHPDIVSLRDRFQFDYGKFDYVVVNGKAILLDTNKTVGRPPNGDPGSEMWARLRYYAEGLYGFLDN